MNQKKGKNGCETRKNKKNRQPKWSETTRSLRLHLGIIMFDNLISSRYKSNDSACSKFFFYSNIDQLCVERVNA